MSDENLNLDKDAEQNEGNGRISNGDGTVKITATTNPDSDYEAMRYAANIGVQSVERENIRLDADNKKKMKQLGLSLAVNAGLIVLVGLMFVGFLSYPKTKYIPTKDNSAICEVYPTNNPNITDATISEFGKDAILNLYTFDYVNFDNQVNAVLTRYFTPIGRQATVQAMGRVGLPEYVKENALTFKATASNAVRIEEKNVNSDGKTYWIVRFPMVLDIYSGKSTPIETQNHIVTVRVVADTASVNNPNGLGVSSVTLAPL